MFLISMSHMFTVVSNVRHRSQFTMDEIFVSKPNELIKGLDTLCGAVFICAGIPYYL